MIVLTSRDLIINLIKQRQSIICGIWC